MNKFPHDAVNWFLNEQSARLTAKSRLLSDCYHLGKLVYQGLGNEPDFILQIDGVTNSSETSGSVLNRSIKCATAFKNAGLKKGDVIALMAPNSLDICIPFYAALYLGIITAPTDKMLTIELLSAFDTIRPKIIFCESVRVSDVQCALNKMQLDSQIVTFDTGNSFCSFEQFLQVKEESEISEFQVVDFEPENTTALLIATSGTTGKPKVIATTHKNLAVSFPIYWNRWVHFPKPFNMILLAFPLQWLTADIILISSAIFQFTTLLTSKPSTPEHIFQLINTYKPSYFPTSPSTMSTLTKPRYRDQCDFTCFETIIMGGSAVSEDIVNTLKELAPNCEVSNGYGMTETTGLILQPDTISPNSPGRAMPHFQYRLVDPDSGKDVTVTHVNGELWLKGPSIFKEYYKNSVATAETFSEDGWFKTGDLFYIDDNKNFFYVDRIKLLIKYKNYRISPVEIENVIRRVSGVSDACVTGMPDPACGESPVACVVPLATASMSAKTIKDAVKDFLSDEKQLRGGVIFVDQFPLTPSGKVDRRKLKELVVSAKRE